MASSRRNVGDSVCLNCCIYSSGVNKLQLIEEDNN
jgi:hypothetical protein